MAQALSPPPALARLRGCQPTLRAMTRRLLNLLTALSLLMSGVAVVAILLFPRDFRHNVYHGTLGWRHGEGWGAAGIGLYEIHAYQGPVVVLALPRSVFNFLLFVGMVTLASASLARKLGTKPPPGLCPRCGYDLRATPGRCPECGTPATTPA